MRALQGEGARLSSGPARRGRPRSGGAAACVAAGVVPPVHVAGHGGIGGHIQRAADESRASPDTGQLGADPIPPAAPEQAPNPEPVDPEPVDSSSARPPTAAPQAPAEFSPEVPAAPT